MRKSKDQKRPYIGLYCDEDFKIAVVNYAEEHDMFIKDVVIEAVSRYLGLEPEVEERD